jgi:TonB family protein
MILYAFEVSFSWLLFYLVYALFLQKESFFSFNRGYLLVSLLGGLLLPFIEIETSNSYLSPLPVLLEGVTVGVEQNLATEVIANSSYFSFLFLMIGIYLIGVMVNSIRFLTGIYSIFKLYKSANIEQQTGYNIATTNNVHSPFSFGKYLFISNQINTPRKEYQYIIEHECTHIREKHSFDILFLEFLGIIFWFNPLVPLYKTALRDQHEYLADRAVLNNNASIKEYGQLLIEQSIPGIKIGLVNHLIYSQLKKRINMMTKKHSLRLPYFKYATSLAAFILAFWTVSCQKQAEPVSSTSTIEEEKIYEEVDRTAYFPGCKLDNKEAAKKCSSKELMAFIGKNIKYPAAAKDKKTEGMAVVRFVINKKGMIQDVETLKNPGEGCGEEAARIVNLMNKKGLIWTPAEKDGKVVSIKYTLPVMFRLE